MRPTIKTTIYLLLCSLILLWPAVYNMFPILNPDTGTYIASGFKLETPIDRPMSYGLFILATSLNGLSLWTVIFAQALIVSWLIYGLLVVIFGGERARKLVLPVVAFLSLFTPLSWTVSQLMADVFTSIGFLSLVLFLIADVSKGRRFLLGFLFLFSVTTHISHVLLFALLLIVIWVLRKRLFAQLNLKLFNRRIVVLFVLALASIASMGSALSKSKHVFFMGAMVEHGIAKEYLDEYCPTVPYKLCAYKDSLPKKAYQFVWDGDSPIQKTGGWKDNKEEYTAIINATLTKPKYIWLHIKASLKASADQIVLFNVGDGNERFLKGSNVYEQVETYLPRVVKGEEKARQNDTLKPLLDVINPLFYGVVILAVIVLTFNIKSIRKNRLLAGIVVVLIIGIVLNAWDCATFANSLGRLGAKVVWLVPMMGAIAITRKSVKNERA